MNRSLRYEEAHRTGFWLGIAIAFSFIFGCVSGCSDPEAQAADEFVHQPPEKAAYSPALPDHDLRGWYSVHANETCGKSESPGDMMETIITNGHQPRFSQYRNIVSVWYSVPAEDMRYTYTYYRTLADCQSAVDAAHYIPSQLR